jgi:hypothetical protein
MDTAGSEPAMTLDFRQAPTFDATAQANRAILVAALERIEAGVTGSCPVREVFRFMTTRSSDSAPAISTPA